MREALKNQFLQKHLPHSRHVFLASDMSTRSYDRVTANHQTFVLMDDENIEDIQRYEYIQTLLSTINVKAPQIYAKDLEHGFLLIEDFGDQTLTTVFKKSLQHEEEYYIKSIDILHQIREGFLEKPTHLKNYHQQELLRETDIFIDFYFEFIHKRKPDPLLKDDWKNLWSKTFSSIEGLTPNTLVLRDYHVDNLMVTKNNQIGVLDFQDALWGSIVYDYISLIEDARRLLSEPLKKKLHHLFFNAFDIQKKNDYIHTADILGAGRHAKVLGVFARYFLHYKNDSKLVHLNHVFQLLFKALQRAECNELLYFLKDQKFLTAA